MLLRLFLLFTFMPVVELYLLLVAASMVGLGNTLLLCLFTGALGAHVARREGLAVLRKVRTEVEEKKVPGGALLEGALVFAGGLLLLTPGMLTDVLGFSLVLPVTRGPLAGWIAGRLQRALAEGALNVTVISGPGGFRGGPGPGGFPGGPGAEDPSDSPGDGYDDPRIRRIVQR